MNLQYEFRHVAESHFSTLPNPVERQFAAEQWLMQQFLEAENRSGWFAEIGANDPVCFSVTYSFEKLGWKGMLVEPQPDLAERCRCERPESVTVEAACGPTGGPSKGKLSIPEKLGHASMIGSNARVVSVLDKPIRTIDVDIRTLDEMLEAYAPSSIDLISIDVEGFTTQVLDGFSIKRWRPRLLLIEDHLLDFSILRHRSLREAGYRMAKRTCGNSWFVPREAIRSVPVTAAERRQVRSKLARIPTRLMTRRIRDAFRRLRAVGRK